MDLMPLRYAVAVADEGTFTAAAEVCFVAQPSLSQAVRNLERELGVELFTRLPRRAQPDGTADLLEAVRDGRSEIGITVSTAGDDGRLVSRPLGRQEIVAVLPPGGRRRRGLTAAELVTMRLVVQPSGTATRALLD